MIRKHQIIIGNALEKLQIIQDKTVDCIITSPPYYALRNYGTKPQIWGGSEDCEHVWNEIKIKRLNLSGGKTKKQLTNVGSYGVDYNDRYSYSHKCNECDAWKGELGQEPKVEMYIDNLSKIFEECKRVLKDEGSLWINIADTYIDSGKQRKGLYCVPDRLKLKLVELDWLCRMEIIWHVTNKMPTSVKDRYNVDHEKLFMFVKQPNYFFDQQSTLGKDGNLRALRTVWSIPNGAGKNSNTASFPEELVKIPLLSSCPVDGTVLDPFAGSGTVLKVAEKYNRNSIGIELKEEFMGNKNNH